MKKIAFSILLLLPLFTKAQIIVTIAGTDTSGFRGDNGPAKNALISQPWGMARDAAGNIYLSDVGNYRVRKIDPSGIISTFAGNGVATYSGDNGPATAAGINGPTGLAVFGSILYIAEGNTSVIRKVDASGTITTFAGNGIGGLHGGYSGDGGPATAASISGPLGLAVDKVGNVYIADQFTNHIRKVDTSGIITTIAGNGGGGYTGDNGPATNATMDVPDGIAVDTAGNVFFADFNNNVIRKVDVAGIITTYAGTGVAGFGGDTAAATAAQLHGACSVSFDKVGNLYICDASNNRIRQVNTSGIINTIAGSGAPGYGGDGGSPVLAKLKNVNLTCVDTAGNIYIGDMYNSCIREIIAPKSVDVCLGSTGVLSDALLPSAGTWMSTNTAVATIGTAGSVDGVTIGTSTISFNSGIYGTVNVITVPATPSAITGAVSVCVGGSITLSDATAGGLWSSVLKSLATAGSLSGLVTGVAVGVDTIRYTVSNSCGTASVSYAVTVKPKSFCASGIDPVNSQLQSGLLVYPNPATTELMIIASDKISRVAITNLVGQTMYSSEYNTGAQVQINIAALPAGVYFVKVNGSSVSKFMKE